MLKPMFTIGEVNARVDGFAFDKETRIRYVLHDIGIEFMNAARQNAQFTDHTGNLRSSIGYCILLDGEVIDEGYDGRTTDGEIQSKRIVRELAEGYNQGYVLIGIAGMEYAAAVESKGFDVITGSTPLADALLTYFKRELKLL